MQIQKQMKEKNRKTVLLSHFLAGMTSLAELIMYYAAALTLNTLYAGIGNMYISLIALLASLGGAAGKFLFTYLREGIDKEIQETCYETLEETVPLKEESDEDALYGFFDDTVHYETEGKLAVKNLLVRNAIRCAALFMISWKCGLLSLAAMLLCGFLTAHFARRNIRDSRTFMMQLSLFPSALFALFGALDLLWAVSMMKSGAIGLYGVIMMILIIMDICREHMNLIHEMPRLRKDLKSFEILDTYMKEEEYTLPQMRRKEFTEASRSAYVLNIAAALLSVFTFVLCGQRILGILSYRTLLSEGMIPVLIPVCALCSAVLYALCEKETVNVIDSPKVRRISCACVSLVSLVYAFAVNPLAAGILLSGMAALEIALPLFMKMRAEKADEEDVPMTHSESFYGVVKFLFIIIFIAAGVLLYWNAMASFADVWTVFVLFMSAMVWLDTKPLINVRTKEEEDGSDEQ